MWAGGKEQVISDAGRGTNRRFISQKKESKTADERRMERGHRWDPRPPRRTSNLQMLWNVQEEKKPQKDRLDWGPSPPTTHTHTAGPRRG